MKSNEKGDGPKNPQKKFDKIKKDKCNVENMKNRAKGQGKGKGETFTCHKCDGPNYFTKKYRTPKYLIELHQKSLNESNNNKRSYETHFNDMTKEASTSGTILSNPEMPMEMDTDDMDIENTIVEYHSYDVYEDLK
jgi:hypothetical protein